MTTAAAAAAEHRQRYSATFAGRLLLGVVRAAKSCSAGQPRPCLSTAAVVSRFSTHAGCCGGDDHVIVAAPCTTTAARYPRRRHRLMRGRGVREFFSMPVRRRRRVNAVRRESYVCFFIRVQY